MIVEIQMKIVEAQAKMNDAQLKLAQAKVLKPQYKSSQTQESGVELNQNSTPNIPKPDAKAQAWQDANTWFGT